MVQITFVCPQFFAVFNLNDVVTHKQTNKRTNGQTNKQTNRQTNKQQTDKRKLKEAETL